MPTQRRLASGATQRNRWVSAVPVLPAPRLVERTREMTAKRITFTYGRELEVEVDTRDYDSEAEMVDHAWAEFGPRDYDSEAEMVDQSPAYDSYVIHDGALKQLADRRAKA